MMYSYTIIEAVIGIVVGIFLAFCTKREDGVTYGKLDKAGCVTNILFFAISELRKG